MWRRSCSGLVKLAAVSDCRLRMLNHHPSMSQSGFGDFVKRKPMVDTRKLQCYSGQSRISEPKLRLGGRPSLTAYTRSRKEQQTDKFRLVLYAIGTLRMPCRRGIPPGSRT